MRLLSVSALFLALASAFLFYSLNYESRKLEAELHRHERTAEQLRGDIAVLKAERAHLARPERIAPLARSQGLRPLSKSQVTTMHEAGSRLVTGSTAKR